MVSIASMMAKTMPTVTRQDLNLSKKDIIFICVGRLVPLKQHKFLFNAFEKFVAMEGGGGNSVLLIAGDGPEKAGLMDYLDEHQLSYIRMLGFQDDIYSLLKLSDCFVLASETEGLSCSIQEAMMASLPIVATDVGGNDELVSNDVNGYLVPNNDVAELSRVLLKIYQDATLRSNFSHASKQIVDQKFSSKSI